MSEELTTAEVAALLEIQPGTWRVYVHRGKAPAPDGHRDARTPFWFLETVTAWQQSRPGQGVRT